MYAVIKTGGKQYRVAPGEKLKVEKLNADVGQEVVFDQVLMTGGESASVGTPLVDHASVQATVESHGRGNKIIVYKFKRRSGYHKKQGHRQDFTMVHIDKILAGGEEYGASKEAPAQKSEDKRPETEIEDVSATDTESEEE